MKLYLVFPVGKQNFMSMHADSCEVSESAVQGSSRSHTHKKGCWQLLCVALSIAVVACLILQSGDIETNPGPSKNQRISISRVHSLHFTPRAVNLVPNDLAKVRHLTREACTKWYSLGLELGLSVMTLDIIKQNNTRVEDRFTKMLSTWLKMTDPPPTWEGLTTALRRPFVEYPNIAERVEAECKRLANLEASSGQAAGSDPTTHETGQFDKI